MTVKEPKLFNQDLIKKKKKVAFMNKKKIYRRVKRGS